MRPMRSPFTNLSADDWVSVVSRPWWMRPSKRRPAGMTPVSRRQLRTLSTLTIPPGGWPQTSCPKLPQWHVSVSKSGGNTGTQIGDFGHIMGSYFLSHIHALGGGVAGYVVPFLFVLSLVVFFHELGHFLVARLCGVRVLTFSIGFGPERARFHHRYGTP